jgi:spermidine synthase
MGIGSYLSKFIRTGLVARFISIELMVGLIGGFSSTLLFLAFSYTESFRFLLYFLVLLIGILVGLEIPLLMRILKERFQFHDLVANVLTFDYLGALGASVLFPVFLVPRLGLARSAILFGMLNAAVALWSTWLFAARIRRHLLLRLISLLVLAALGFGMAAAERIIGLAESNLYADEVILARTTRYQRIVVTKWKDDIRLFLNSHLQFSSRDEYRYHEALVHPGLAALQAPRRALVLGGGDGMAVREILRYPYIETVTLVDLDPEVTTLFRDHPLLSTLNGNSLQSPRVEIVNEDAFLWIDRPSDPYDFIAIDFPDPTNYSLGKLYTTAFYRALRRHLRPGGYVAVQSTSPLFARQSFWCIVETLRHAGWNTWPYHVYVPSFGEWGFVLAGLGAWQPPVALPGGLRFLEARNLASLFQFPPDMSPLAAQPNRLNDQNLVRYYDREWANISR